MQTPLSYLGLHCLPRPVCPKTWAASRQNQQNDCARSEASAQSDQFSLCDQWVAKPKLSSCRQWRLWSAWADAQADLIRPGWSESSLGAHVSLLVLSWGGSLEIIFAFFKQLIYGNSNINWATSWEISAFAIYKQKNTDQPAHPCSLMSTFLVYCLDSIIPLLVIAEISRPKPVSVAERAGLSLTWWQTPKTGFLVTWFNFKFYWMYQFLVLEMHMSNSELKSFMKQVRNWTSVLLVQQNCTFPHSFVCFTMHK